MQYVGSKNRLAKHILPTMLSARKDNQCWVEPFVGGANMIDKVDGWRVGNDTHEYLIALLQAVQDGWEPPTELSRETYYNIKNNPDSYSAELVGFAGFLCSFGGKWWGGYAHNNSGTNYAAMGCRSLAKQFPKLQGVELTRVDYRDMVIPPKSLIYCDPPYRDTTGYGNTFDSVSFWEWCRERVKEGHTIFVSEYQAPSDFDIVKTIEVKSTLNKNEKQIKLEKLFTKEGELSDGRK